MRKISWFTFALITLATVISSCSKTETYADKLKNEEKMIEQLLKDSGFVVINTYPSNGVFEKNQFYKDATTGVYFNVVDSGNGTRASKTAKTSVQIRFKNARMLPDATLYTNDAPNGELPMSISYGVSSTYLASSGTAYAFLSPGITLPLQYVGEMAIVKVIVPFNLAFNQGSTWQQSAYIPIYYGHLQYKAFD